MTDSRADGKTGGERGGIAGDWIPDLAPLAAAFAESVRTGEERGGLCVMKGGAVLLDIHGGMAAPGRPWAPDTLACCFSVTKGVLAILAHRLIDAGLLDPTRPVAAYWPDFASEGKGAITVADVLTHRAGLPAVSGPVARGDLYDWEVMTGHLARSAPVVPPRAAPVYHNMTWGYLVGEILCRAAGIRPFEALLEAELTGPLGADFRMGMDPADQARCAMMTQDDPEALFAALERDPDSLFARSMRFFGAGEDFNSPRWRGAAIGSGNGHATARGLAAIFGQTVWDGALLSPARQAALRVQTCASDGPDPILGIPIRYAEGLELSGPPALDFGPNPETPGHWGAGGAQAFADPATGIAFGYVTGRMDPAMGSSARARRLAASLYACLA
jgi:CubicO group peptidase (beta-lactamase class C family)